VGVDRRAGVAGLPVIAVEGDVEGAARAEDLALGVLGEGLGPFLPVAGREAVGEDVARPVPFAPVVSRGGDRLRFDEAAGSFRYRDFEPARIALRGAVLDDADRPAENTKALERTRVKELGKMVP